MYVTVFRTLILYILLVVVMRITGKRQIGQLQPVELVITMLISEVAAIPMQDNDVPMINSIVAVLLLAASEIVVSAIAMKSIRFRSLLQGNPVIIIRNGVLDQKQMKRLRYTVDDLLEALREKDVFSISDVQYAVAETDGSLSVLLKPEKRGVTVGDTCLRGEKSSVQCVVICDGRIISSGMKDCGMTENRLRQLLAEKNLRVRDVLLLSSDPEGNTDIIKKENEN
jgi:uncharacterized membrane protein YcaP (DUF421 family)